MPNLRCAIYTRKSSEEGLEQDFNSLDAQREACAAFIQSQRHEGWTLIPGSYDDGGVSGGTMNRPALQRLLEDIEQGLVDVVVVYKVDRLTRSLSDFARIVEIFDKKGVSFVSVTQQFNTTSSMGRLTLNVLLSFAQFEREVTGERIRDKFAASRRKGIFMGGNIPLGYDLDNRRLVINEADADLVRRLFSRYLELGCATRLKAELDREGLRSRARISQTGRPLGGTPYSRGMLYYILKNRVYIGEAVHKGISHPGEHQPIIDEETFRRVQVLIGANRRIHVTKSRSAEPSPLAGLVFDHLGRRLTPRHSNRRGLRYRYYVSGPAQDLADAAPARAVRVTAHDLEQVVTDQLGRLIGDPGRLSTVLQIATPIIDEHSTRRREFITSLGQSPQQALAAFRQVIHRVIVGQQDLTIQIDRPGLAAACGLKLGKTAEAQRNRRADADTYDLNFRAAFRRIGSEMKLILIDEHPAARKPKPDPVLIKALARAHKWTQLLYTGAVTSIREIAAAEGLNPRYLAGIMPLAYLAPDITVSILGGTQSLGLNLERLQKGFPADWAEQRRVLGFTAPQQAG